MRRLALVCLLVLAAAFPLQASTETERLAALARVWATAEFLDPDVVFGEIDWDAALIHAIPKVRAAKSDEELARAVGSMLAELHDSATRIVETPSAPKQADVPLSRRDGDVLIINAGPYGATHASMWAEMRPLGEQIGKSKAVVVDLRFHGDHDGADNIAYSLSTLSGLAAGDVAAPANDFVMHSGFPPEGGSTSGGYFTSLLTIPGTTFTGTSGPAPARVAFVTDSRSPLPDLVAALQKGGKAAIISADPLDAAALAATREVPVIGSWRATVRVSRPRGGLAADLVSADPMADALAFARGEKTLPPRSVAAPSAAAAEPRVNPPHAYAEMTYPDAEHRVFAAVRFWSVISYFYPYKALIGDWDAVLTELLPKFIDAKDADQYAAAVLEMTARVEDGHSGAYGHPSAVKLIGQAQFPGTVRLIENEFVVTRVVGDAANAVVHVGDLVVSVDGEPMRARVERMRKFITASTERARINRLAAAALRGAPGSEAVLEVKGADGALRTARVARTTAPYKPPDTPPYEVLEGNIGYVDLTRLMPSQVDAMFEALMKTKAIIFNMRGYPNGTAWPIAPRINTRNAKVGAIFRRAEVSGAVSTDTGASGFFFEQTLPLSDKPKYTGKTVMLIDDRAISQSEHTGLFFEAASGITFIGSPSAGANGDVTNFSLPGGFRVGFTGHDVRHADGRQLQRVGLRPDIVVEPTIRGIREGRDEVRDRAVAYINGLGH
jgi:C-terminal processing protease CtpA/Prc